MKQQESPHQEVMRAQSRNKAVAVVIALLGVVVAVGVYFAAWVVIKLLYDAHYFAALKYLQVLLLYYIFRSGFSIIGTALISLGLPKYNFLMACITTPIGLVFSYIALTHFGILGVAWAQVGTGALSLLLFIGMAHYVLNHHYQQEQPRSST